MVSSENFPGDSEEDIDFLLNLLFSANFLVKIIVYFRRQDEFLESWFNQVVKSGEFGGNIYTLKEQLSRQGLFDYKKLIDRWEKYAGKGAIIVRPYEKCQFVNENLYCDFLSLFGIYSLEGFNEIKAQENSSLPRDQILLIQAFHNVGLSHLVNEELRKPFSINNLKPPKYFLPPNERAEIVNNYSKMNLEIARNYLNVNRNLFVSSLPNEREEWYPPTTLALEYMLIAMYHMISNKVTKDKF